MDTVVLDKTGTLTTGKPEVTDVLPGAVSGEALMRIAAALESKSEHPFAKAILNKMEDTPYPTAEDFKTLPAGAYPASWTACGATAATAG